MLKDMIKDIMHDPDYMEVCHEVIAVLKIFYIFYNGSPLKKIKKPQYDNVQIYVVWSCL